MATNINTILSWFKTRSKPTQKQFHATLLSFWHKDEQIPQASISNLTTTLDTKTDQSQFDAHITDDNAHATTFEKKLDKGDYNGTAQHLKNDINSVISNLDNNYYTIPKIDSKISEKQDMLTDVNFGTFQNTLTTVSSISDTDKIHFLAGKLTRIISWTNFKNLFKTINGNSIFGTGDVTLGDMTTDTDQSVSGIKTFLNGKFGLRNVANTFSSFFTNINTASRTYTLPDKSGTIAMTSDLPATIINSGLQNRLTKYNSANEIRQSRLTDNGDYFGIDTVNIPTKDITLSYNSNRTIGIELSDSTTVGRELSVAAGSTVNYTLNPNITVTSDPISNYRVIGSGYNGKVYIAGWNMNIYSSDNGNLFTSLGFRAGGTGQECTGICGGPNDEIYYTNYDGIFFKKVGTSTANVMNISFPSATKTFICVARNGNVYITSNGGKIYLQTGGIGNFEALPEPNRPYTGICSAPNGDIYTCTDNGDIYVRVLGIDNFVALGQTRRAWNGICSTNNGDIYACVSNGDIYKRFSGTANFIALNQTNRSWRGIASGNNMTMFSFLYESNIFKLNTNSLGTNDLNGGKLTLKSGTGKGTGKNSIEFYTGQKTISGTDMQIETLRFYIDENGFFVYLTPPIYTSDTAADEDTNLPSGAYYKITGNRTLFQKP